MRTTGPILLLLLSACAAPPGPGIDPRWNEIQRDRLERLYQPRRPADAVAALLGQDPKPAAARRDAHIDQREPVAAGVGPRQFRPPSHPLVAQAAFGVGTVAARVSGTRLDDRAPALFTRVAVDAGSGAALHADVWGGEAELFQGTHINDGVAPADAEAALGGIQLFPHLRLDSLRQGDLSMPVRVGLFGDWQQLDHERAGVERAWLSLGPRLLLEPTWRFVGDDHAWLELMGRLGGEAGAAWFTEEFHGGDDRALTSRWSVEVGGSLRAHVGRMQAELGYGLHHATFGRIDSDLLGDRSKTELQRQQVFFGLGLKF